MPHQKVLRRHAAQKAAHPAARPATDRGRAFGRPPRPVAAEGAHFIRMFDRVPGGGRDIVTSFDDDDDDAYDGWSNPRGSI